MIMLKLFSEIVLQTHLMRVVKLLHIGELTREVVVMGGLDIAITVKSLGIVV